MERLAKILLKVAEQWGLQRHFPRSELFAKWEEIAGPDLAKRCWPSSIRKGILTVRVINSMWMQEIQFFKEEILKRIRLLPRHEQIRDLRFTTRGGVPPHKKGAHADAVYFLTRALDPEEELWIQGRLENIKDLKVKASLRRILELHLKSQRGR